MTRLLAFLILLPGLAWADAWDGDSIIKEQRMWGIDAPEKRQQCEDAAGQCFACGKAATDAMTALTANGYECFHVKGEWAQGRPVELCYAGSVNLALEMIRQGWAVAYTEPGTDYLDRIPELRPVFLAAQAEAEAAKRGMHAGKFDLPAQWRRGNRSVCVKTP